MIDLELAGPNYRGFDLMKLFRTAPEQFSSDAFQTFLVNYNSQVSTTFELERECKFCMTLSWLEAAVFFANLISSGDDSEATSSLFINRWKFYLMSKDHDY